MCVCISTCNANYCCINTPECAPIAHARTHGATEVTARWGWPSVSESAVRGGCKQQSGKTKENMLLFLNKNIRMWRNQRTSRGDNALVSATVPLILLDNWLERNLVVNPVKGHETAKANNLHIQVCILMLKWKSWSNLWDKKGLSASQMFIKASNWKLINKKVRDVCGITKTM